MIQDRIRNILLTVIALLLFVNLVVTFAPPVHAVGKAQYKAIYVRDTDDGQRSTQNIQQALDQQSAQGWEYVGEVIVVGGSSCIFRK